MLKNDKEQNVTEIEKTVGFYFDGYLKAEPETLLKAFDRGARLFSTDNGSLEKTEMAAWLENLRERRTKGDIREANVEILEIDVTGDAAIAKTKLSFSKFSFTDYLSLLKIKGQWVIVNKIYTTDEISRD